MKRNQIIDVAKFVAVAGVVFIHVAPSEGLAVCLTQITLQFAVPFFVITSLYFTLKGKVISFKRIHFKRLLLPYVLWSIVYIALRLMKHSVIEDDRSWDVLGVVFFGKAATGLYFIPMLISYQIICVSVMNVLRWRSNAPMFNLFCFILVIFFVFLSISLKGTDYLGFNNLIIINALLYGFSAKVVDVFITSKEYVLNRRVAIFLGLLVIILLCLANTYMMGLRLFTIPLMASLLLSLCLIAKEIEVPPKLQKIAACSFGVYLTHTCFDQFYELLYVKFLGGVLPYMIVAKLVMWLVILISSTVFIYVLRQYGWVRKFFIGESR
ncbi:acyltransferase family protein [Rubritalea marina]|uniref:acyltransferase family protein n=1 Tax=Rubritalea marina TaxID=361055 RepID=UPI0003817751|nr:acyltransferase [Rubritalea marina]